jgi:hypothetical protein
MCHVRAVGQDHVRVLFHDSGLVSRTLLSPYDEPDLIAGERHDIRLCHRHLPRNASLTIYSWPSPTSRTASEDATTNSPIKSNNRSKNREQTAVSALPQLWWRKPREPSTQSDFLLLGSTLQKDPDPCSMSGPLFRSLHTSADQQTVVCPLFPPLFPPYFPAAHAPRSPEGGRGWSSAHRGGLGNASCWRIAANSRRRNRNPRPHGNTPAGCSARDDMQRNFRKMDASAASHGESGRGRIS